MKYPCVAAFLLFPATVFGQLHFASLGNWGTGTGTQVQVATTLKSKVKDSTVTFIVSPGSNFIGGGIQEFNDTKWETCFEKPYNGEELQMPFFSVLGSDDWEGNFTALALRSNETYGEEEDKHPKWTMPNWWYHYILHFRDASSASAAFAGSDVSVGFVFIDTWILNDDFIFANITKLAWDDLKATVRTASKIVDWVIVVGNKPILSSGASKGDSYLDKTLRPLLKEFGVDAYISGKDYDLEILEDGPLTLLNCGSGGASDPVKLRVKNEQSFAFHPQPGFCLHTLTEKGFTTELIDGISGKVLDTYTQQKKRRDKNHLDRFNLYKTLPEVTFIPIPEFPVLPIPAESPFIKIVGTFGLLVFTLLVVLAVATLVGKATKQ